MVYKKSRYNSLIDVIDGGVLVFNTVTSAILWLPQEMWNIEEYSGELTGEWEVVVHAGIWVEYSKNEIEEIHNCLQLASKQPPEDIAITIVPTYSCNMKCEYCFQHDKCEPIMSVETANIVLQSVIEIISRYKAAHITWFGGEPLLAIGVIEYLSNELINFCDSHAINYSADLITNGTLLSENNAAILHRCRISFIQITLDGMNHDSVRKMKDGSSSYSLIVNNIVNNVNDFTIAIRSNVTENNVDSIKAMIDDLLVNHQLANKVYFSYYPVSEFEGKTSKGCDYKPLCRMDMYSERLLELITHVIQYQPLTTVTNINFRPSTVPCEVISKDTACFDAYGDVYKCGLSMQNTDLKIGNVLERSISDILNDGDQNGWLSFEWDKECVECNFLPMCHSGCIFRKKASNKSRICSIDRTTHRGLVKLMYECFQGEDT